MGSMTSHKPPQQIGTNGHWSGSGLRIGPSNPKIGTSIVCSKAICRDLCHFCFDEAANNEYGPVNRISRIYPRTARPQTMTIPRKAMISFKDSGVSGARATEYTSSFDERSVKVRLT